MLADITVNGFTDDHSLRKSFPASDLGKQNSMQRKLEHTLAVNKFLDGHNEINSKHQQNRTHSFWFQSPTLEIPKKPLTTGNHTIQMSSDIKYLEGTPDSQLSFNKDITMKIWKVFQTSYI